MMMERKFRCIKAYNDAFGNIYNEGEIVVGIKTNTDKFYTLERDSKFVCQSTSIQGRNWQEITEPRIELKCVGFEEGDMFKLKGLAKVYKVENGVLFYDSISGGWSQSIMEIGRINGAEIELLPQPTEEDKQIAELKETIEEAMRKIEEIEKARE